MLPLLIYINRLRRPLSLGLNATDATPYKTDPLFPGPNPCIIEFLALGSHIHVKNGYINIRGMVFGNKRLLDGIHATN